MYDIFSNNQGFYLQFQWSNPNAPYFGGPDRFHLWLGAEWLERARPQNNEVWPSDWAPSGGCKAHFQISGECPTLLLPCYYSLITLSHSLSRLPFLSLRFFSPLIQSVMFLFLPSQQRRAHCWEEIWWLVTTPVSDLPHGFGRWFPKWPE